MSAREVLAVRYGHRVTRQSEMFLNFHRYREPDADLALDYYFWVIRDAAGVFLVDTGFDPGAGERRRRKSQATPAQVLPRLGIDPGDVTAVVITHAHWDHVGNVRQFPHAQLMMTEAEYAFWTSPLAARAHFASETEPAELGLLRERRTAGTLTLFSGQATLAPGIELIEVGGHTPGQLIAAVGLQADGPQAYGPQAAGTGVGGTVVLASDALHFYQEIERDRPFAIVADLPAMYRAYDTMAQLASQPGTTLVAGHDPEVRARFAPAAAYPAGEADEVQVTDLGLVRRPPVSSGPASR